MNNKRKRKKKTLGLQLLPALLLLLIHVAPLKKLEKMNRDLTDI
jgi:hypothetical protein